MNYKQQLILSMKNQSSHPEFSGNFQGPLFIKLQAILYDRSLQNSKWNLGFYVWGMEACSIEFFLRWSICMRYFGLPFLAIAVQNQAKFECNSTKPNNRNTLSNCINLTAAAILSSKQISQPFKVNDSTEFEMKVIVLKET